MKKAPCVRLASLIRPKISEKPEESKNNRPPSDRLLRPWMIQNCIVGRSCPESLRVSAPNRSAVPGKDRVRGHHAGDTCASNAGDKLPSRYPHWTLPRNATSSIGYSC